MSAEQHEVITLAKTLMARPSVTPDDQGCQTLIAEYLKPLGFDIESMPFGDTLNMWARAKARQHHFFALLATLMWYRRAKHRFGIAHLLSLPCAMVFYMVAVRRI